MNLLWVVVARPCDFASRFPECTAADILGHEKPTMTYGLYSGGANLEVKRKAIEKISYELKVIWGMSA